VAAGQGRRPGSNRRPAAGRSRDQRGRRAVDGAPAHPTGRAAARRRAHQQNPWRERILLSGWQRADRHFAGFRPGSL
jgi:hypothetical protein